VLLILWFPWTAHAQAANGSAGTASSTGGNYTVMGTGTTATSHSQAQSKSPHVMDSGGTPADEANRKALEQRAGSDGGKLLLRSEPNGAQIFVDGAFVGRAPLLLIVAPGKYKIQMRGPREAFGERMVGLAAKETQEVVLTLTARYPEHVATR
jgi:hypothetical protein